MLQTLWVASHTVARTLHRHDNANPYVSLGDRLGQDRRGYQVSHMCVHRPYGVGRDAILECPTMCAQLRGHNPHIFSWRTCMAWPCLKRPNLARRQHLRQRLSLFGVTTLAVLRPKSSRIPHENAESYPMDTNTRTASRRDRWRCRIRSRHRLQFRSASEGLLGLHQDALARVASWVRYRLITSGGPFGEGLLPSLPHSLPVKCLNASGAIRHSLNPSGLSTRSKSEFLPLHVPVNRIWVGTSQLE